MITEILNRTSLPESCFEVASSASTAETAGCLPHTSITFYAANREYIDTCDILDLHSEKIWIILTV